LPTNHAPTTSVHALRPIAQICQSGSVIRHDSGKMIERLHSWSVQPVVLVRVSFVTGPRFGFRRRVAALTHEMIDDPFPIPRWRIAAVGIVSIVVGFAWDSVLWLVGVRLLAVSHAAHRSPWNVEVRSTLSGDVLRSWAEPSRSAARERAADAAAPRR
jgi:hypothetical protein